MEFDTFKNQYDKRLSQLKKERKALETKLQEGIQLIQKERESKGVPAGMFRIRLKEARVKPVKSLFDKITDDEELSFDDAFTPSHVRDLLGARLVCHNISDVHSIVDSLQTGGWGDLHYVKPKKGDKIWIDEPQESGYRGAHVDVRWLRPRSRHSKYSYAELQIRTLLQDAWANFMHDDVHKAGAKLLLGEESFRHFRDMSNILYAVDIMAEGIRTGVEQARIATHRIKASESISQAMFSILAYQKAAKHQPRYKSVERRDRYVVRGDDGYFSFELNAMCFKKEPFVFAMAGDTSSDLAKNITVERFSEKTNSWEKLVRDVHIEKHVGTPNGIILRCNSKELRHRYKITCVWGGVFREGTEYVWCPWVSTYGTVVRKYSLELAFNRTPAAIPRLFEVSAYDSLNKMIEAATIGSGKEGDMTKKGNQSSYLFVKENLDDDFLCLFRS